MADPLPPTHDVGIVEASLLELLLDAHPRRLSAAAAIGSIVSEGADAGEEEVARRALANLVEFGLLRRAGGDHLTPTVPAVRAFCLLA